MAAAALLTTALLFGGMTLYSFGFAAFVFNALPAETAGPLIRRAFPHFYLFVLGVSLIGAVLVVGAAPVSAIVLASDAATTIFARQILMPAITGRLGAAGRGPAGRESCVQHRDLEAPADPVSGRP